MLDDDVDCSGFQLDQVRVGVDEVAAQRLTVCEVGRDVDDLRVELRDVARSCREDRDPPLERPRRPEPQLEVLDDDVGDEPPVRVQVVVARVTASDHENSAIDVDRRDRGATPVEDHDIGAALCSERRARGNVRDEDGAGQAAARAPAADRRHAGKRGDLEVIGRGVEPGARPRDQIIE